MTTRTKPITVATDTATEAAKAAPAHPDRRTQRTQTDARTPPLSRGQRGWFPQLLLRLHFYAGLLVGPFILIAAVSGGLYAIAPTVEQVVYSHELRAPAPDDAGDQLALSAQIEAAQQHAGGGATLTAVRPAPPPGDTTRVLFADPGLGDGESRAIFIDPSTGEIRGDETAYGTSGALSVRTWISNLHRSLHLGEGGRLYSELAASWLGIVALAGFGLWLVRIRRSRTKRDFVRPNRRYSGFRKSMSWHASLGVWVMIGALFLSATGITWSKYAGEHVGELRAALAWGTPSVNTALGAGSGSAAANPATFDAVLAIGQRLNINAGQVEIRPPAEPGTAWTIREIKSEWPTEIDSLAIDGSSLEVVDRVDFADYPVAAKLARWGIDAHMGVLFGIANQIVLLVLAVGIAALVVLGYRMWWQRRPTRAERFELAAGPRRGALRGAPWWGAGLVLVGAVAIGWFLPLVGWTLAAFVVIDVLRSAVTSRR